MPVLTTHSSRCKQSAILGHAGQRCLCRDARTAWTICRRLAMLPVLLGCQEEVAIRLLEPPERRIEASDETSAVDDVIADSGVMLSDAERQTDAGVEPDASHLPDEALIHHYDFGGEGTIVADIVGNAEGELMGGAVLDGAGGVVLDGVDDYVDLPNGLISSLSSVTIVVWFEWYGGRCWQRVFDFGSSVQGEDSVSGAETSLFVTPASCNDSHVGPVYEHVTLAMFHVRDNAYVAQQEHATLSDNEPAFVALAVDPNRLTLTVNAAVVAELPSPPQVSELNDVNNWLGRSQWAHDPTLNGRIDDVQIYDRALTESQLRRIFAQTAGQR